MNKVNHVGDSSFNLLLYLFFISLKSMNDNDRVQFMLKYHEEKIDAIYSDVEKNEEYISSLEEMIELINYRLDKMHDTYLEKVDELQSKIEDMEDRISSLLE